MALKFDNYKKVVKKGKLGMEIYVGDKKEGGYTAFFHDFPNMITQGETLKEARQNLWNLVYDVLKNFTSNK